MAATAVVSPATVQRIWKAHGLKRHRVRMLELSRDPQFVDKLRQGLDSVFDCLPGLCQGGKDMIGFDRWVEVTVLSDP